MHDDRFDDELKNRLGNYTEEPDDALWQGVAAGISSTSVGLGWLRWWSRGFLVSFAVVSILVNDSRFKIQDSKSPTVDGLAVVLRDSKIQISDSRLDGDEAGGLVHRGDVFGQATSLDSAMERNDDGRECEELTIDENGSRFAVADSKFASGRVKKDRSTVAGSPARKALPGLKATDNAAKIADRRARADLGYESFEARRSKAEEKKMKARVEASRREERGPAVEARRSRAAVGADKKLVGPPRAEEQKTAVGPKPSRPEEKDSRPDVSLTVRQVSSGSASSKDLTAGDENKPEPVFTTGATTAMQKNDVANERSDMPGYPLANIGSGVTTHNTDVRMNDGAAVAGRTEVKSGGDSTAEDMSAVFGPPLMMRRDTVPLVQQGMRRTPETAVVQTPLNDSTALMKRKAARAEALKKEDNRKRDDREPGRLSLYFTAMPTLGYQRVEANPADNIIVESFQKVSNFSSKRLGVRAEFGAEYALTSRVRVFGGVLYYQRKQTINYVERVETGVEYHASGDTLTLDPQFSLEQKAFEYELKNVGVQVGVNYVLWKKKFLHVAGTGIEFHKALNKLSEAQKLQGFSSNPSTYVFYNLYYRVQYPAEGRLKAIFQPTLNYSLFLNRDMNAPFYVKPYGLGLNLGVTYSF